MKSRCVLVVGSNGYIGSKLVPRLLEQGYRVRCLVRDRNRVAAHAWSGSVEVMEGDVLDASSLNFAFQHVSTTYYLVHSMTNPAGDFDELDRQAARNVGDVAKRFGVDRIIYLGGLGKRRQEQSLHLRSRHEVGDILRASGIPVTEFRAAVVVGAGSLSFEMIHHLANRLPVMICPRWVVTQTQPISIDDVLAYLVAALKLPQSTGRIVDIGGPEILTYRDMMLRVARALGLRRWLIQVPVLTPRLSSYWVGLVTPVPVKPARALIEGLRHETICENDDAKTIFEIVPIGFDQAVERALSAVLSGQSDARARGRESVISHLEPSHLLIDRRQLAVKASSDKLFHVVSSIGGENGWYAANLLWKIRGLIDEMVGGVGLRRGRSDSNNLAVGDALDFWRVEELDQGKRILLRAEMKLPGKAWLEFEVDGTSQSNSSLTQTARFYPRGLLGIVYWYGIYPVHVLVFRRLAAAIGKRAES
ncbi:MAG: SDR family oxidoreductase [bacterium]|nr:SDR family oxidoreductase [bacterium]